MRINHDLSTTPHHFVKKGWGYEIWIHNDSDYCGKILHMDAGKQFSYHYHKIKKETFYVRKGRVLLTYGYDEDISNAKQVVLGPDSSFLIPPGMIHRLYALEDTDVFEFSTQHFDDDSYRVIFGD